MLHFTVDARDGAYAAASACDTCCCEHVTGQPGERNAWRLMYGGWSGLIGGHGLQARPVALVERLGPATADPATGLVLSPAFLTGSAVQNGAQITLPAATTAAQNGTGNTLTYRILPQGAPTLGQATIEADGDPVTYTPNTGGNFGIDRFFVEVKDTVTNEVEYLEYVVYVEPSNAANPALTPLVANAVPTQAVVMGNPQINKHGHFVTWPVAISAAARIGDIYRATITQTTMDCDGEIYTHVSCYDVTIGKCR